MDLRVWDPHSDELAENWLNIDRHTGTACGCIKRCVYDGGTGYGHREAVERGDKPKYEALTWTS
jgi:hypothetical protein